VTEEILDLRMRHVPPQGFLDDLHDGFADQRREEGGDDDLHGERTESPAAPEIGVAPFRPEIGNHRQHGAGVQHDEQQRHRRR